MKLAVSAAGEPCLHIRQAEPNLWWLAFGALPRPITTAATARPSEVVAELGDVDALTLCKVELDTCGAWVTLANADGRRPIVVRRAGWVDVRGHPFEAASPLGDDRVGLGPGDALVLAHPMDDDTTTDAFLDALLARAGDVDGLRVACAAVPSVVLAVPDDLGADPRQRVADATGIPVDDLDLPGYPLGDAQPELWGEPPRPPRLARLALRDASSAREVRSLLDRLIASWRLTDRVDENDVKLAASELATNALRHSGEPETATVRYLGGGVRIEVDDGSRTHPEMREAVPDDFGGRGLHVVDAVSSAWGVESRTSGKRVWCEISLRTP
ncbi:MAG TPA: ATP-binding protein [Acidimicrobiales bacterium]|nr:ATP-binding protein [Acidimicrobiales bacterium]